MAYFNSEKELKSQPKGEQVTGLRKFVGKG